MRFEHSRMLILMAIALPLLSWFLWAAWRKKQAMIAQFVQSRLLAQLTVGVSKGLQKARLALVALAVALLMLSLARPQWGTVWEEARQRGLDIVVAIDTSRSMLAEDVRPNRLRRAKLAALDLMKLARNDRLGLVAFAGTAFLQCPLTLDDEAFRQSVDALEPGIIPQGGTAIHEAISTALTAFDDDENHKILVLFTDGEDHESGIEAVIERAGKKQLRIFTIGVGTPNGELLRVTDENGQSAYVKDEDGNVVKSRMDEALLTHIATETDGFYLPMTGANAMEVLYERGLAPLPKSELSSKLTRRMKEQYQWPLALAIALLLIEMFLPEQRRVRRTEAIANATNQKLRDAVAILALLLFIPAAQASPSSARKNYESGRYEEARKEYLRLLNKRPEDHRLEFNAGAAAYQAQKYDEAAKHFEATLQSVSDLPLQQGAYYNLGNSLFRVGEQMDDPQAKIASWEKAAEQYQSALKLNAEDKDAQFNLEQVKKKLEEFKKQQQKQQQNKDDSSEDDKKKKDDSSEQNPQDQKGKDDQKQKDGKEDQKQEPQKDDPEKNDSPSDAKEKEEQKKQQEQKSEQRKEDEKSDQKQPEPGKSQDTNSTSSAASGAPLGQMTPEQAKQILDAQKSEEKAMIFAPPDKKERSRNRVIRDW